MPLPTGAPASMEAWRLSLPAHPDEPRTGAVWLEPSPADFPALWLPGIAAHAAAGSPADGTSFESLVREPRLNQGAEGSCVAGSTEACCQMAHSALDGTWPAYSIHQLYAEAGGTGQNGVDVRTVMGICIDRGTPLVSGSRDSLIKSYVFVDRTPGVFRAQVKAALAAGHPVLIASLLPIPFGWNTGMVLSSAYHQYLAIGWYTDQQGVEQALVLNQWGDNWPGDAPGGTPPGVGRISFDALEQNELQQGYTYGVIPTTTLVTPPVPTPTPTPTPAPVTTRTLSGPVEGQGLALLAVGQSLSVSGNGFAGNLTIAQITDGAPTPDPHPQPKPDPAPAGSVVVVPFYQGGLLKAQVHDSSGQLLSAYCDAVVGGVDKGRAVTTPTRFAVWVLRGGPAGTPVTITAVTTETPPRTGSVSMTL